MKHTAVEWLYERLERMIPRTSLYDIDKRKYFEQAKAMEKWQMIDRYATGQADTVNMYEQHLNKTFNTNEK
jgi:hypothetical protein